MKNNGTQKIVVTYREQQRMHAEIAVGNNKGKKQRKEQIHYQANPIHQKGKFMYRSKEKVNFYKICAIEDLPSETCMVGSLLFNFQWGGNYNLNGSIPETQKHKRNQKRNNTLLSYNSYDVIS